MNGPAGALNRSRSERSEESGFSSKTSLTMWCSVISGVRASSRTCTRTTMVGLCARLCAANVGFGGLGTRREGTADGGCHTISAIQAQIPAARDSLSSRLFILWPPGTGKTSLVSALAEHFALSIYTVNLTEFNDRSLITAVNQVPANSVLLFEEIDCMKSGHEGEYAKRGHVVRIPECTKTAFMLRQASCL